MTTTPAVAPLSAALDRNAIRAIFLQHGFTIKEGQTDLKPYVYEAADALIAQARAAQSGLNADEMARLRRMMRALSIDEKRWSDEQARDAMCTVFGMAAGQLEGIAADRAQQAGAAALSDEQREREYFARHPIEDQGAGMQVADQERLKLTTADFEDPGAVIADLRAQLARQGQVQK